MMKPRHLTSSLILRGLIAAIAQDFETKEILMQAWMNQEAFDKTLETGEVHYWSRSRQELWHKGGTSGSTQIVKEIRIDCDQDSIILLVNQNGQGACHTGRPNCFLPNSRERWKIILYSAKN